MKKLIYIPIVLILIISGKVNAQHASHFSLSYNVSFPSGDLGDFIEKTSWRGHTLEWKGFVNEKMSAGVEASWQTFYQSLDFNSFNVEGSNITLTGKQYRYNNVIPIYGRFDYHGSNEGDNVRWFAGLGVGTMWSEHITDMGLYEFLTNTWHFAMAPRIGVNYYLNDWRALTLSLSYDYGFKAQDVDPVSYLRLGIGISFIN
jgi:hypothetical protein